MSTNIPLNSISKEEKLTANEKDIEKTCTAVGSTSDLCRVLIPAVTGDRIRLLTGTRKIMNAMRLLGAVQGLLEWNLSRQEGLSLRLNCAKVIESILYFNCPV